MNPETPIFYTTAQVLYTEDEVASITASLRDEVATLKAHLFRLKGWPSPGRVVDLEFCPSCNSHHVAGNCT